MKRFLRRWFLANTVLAGIFALAWLLLRSAAKPSRFTYPCQQAAFSTAALAFGAPVVSALVSLRRKVASGLLTPQTIAAAAIGLITTAGMYAWLSSAGAYTGPVLSPPADYRARVFHQAGCAANPAGDRFPGLDDLIEKMGGHGLKFFRSDVESLTAGPEGILAANDVIVLKINYQWPERGGTNTDLLRGLIERIVNHPDGFTGEVVVCENAQFASTSDFDRAENNAQDIGQSPADVVADFQARGHMVSWYDWTPIRFDQVMEYISPDLNDGYIIYPINWDFVGRESYPKFRTDYGTYISMRFGVWSEASGYDRERLKMINLPVLKSHHSTYGATVAVKNYMGVVTREQATNSHGAIEGGILGSVIGEIQPADLNIIDAIWINADPNTGPATTYEGATRRDELVASLDPVAADIWSVKNILVPGFLDNGHTPPWPYPSADPDDPTSEFRVYLDNSMNQILAKGYTVTNDFDQIDLMDTSPPGEASEPGGGGAPFTIAKHAEGYELSWSDPVRGGTAEMYHLYRTDLAASPGIVSPECEAYLGTGNTAIVTTLPDNHGFLVVARNSVSDGSFGEDSDGRERPNGGGLSACP